MLPHSPLGKDNGANQWAPAPWNTCHVGFNVAQQDERGQEADGCFYKHSRSLGHQQHSPSSRWRPSLLGQLALKWGGTSVEAWGGGGSPGDACMLGSDKIHKSVQLQLQAMHNCPEF